MRLSERNCSQPNEPKVVEGGGVSSVAPFPPIILRERPTSLGFLGILDSYTEYMPYSHTTRGTAQVAAILALPVHDSFIVWHSKRDRLIEVMKDKYQAHMSQIVYVKTDVSWMDENLPAEAKELHEAGMRFYDDFQANIVERPEYAHYRKRLSDFIAEKEEAWGHRHSFYG